MSAAKHTPGPWIAGHPGWVGGLDLAIRPSSGAGSTVGFAPIARVVGDKRCCTDEQRNANIRLIAAAPELLDMLRQCHDYLSCIPESAAGGDDEAVMLTRNASQIIAKATGLNQ